MAAVRAEVSDRPFVLDIRDAPRSPWFDRLETLGRTIMMGVLAEPRDAFDNVIFFSSVTPAEKAAG